MIVSKRKHIDTRGFSVVELLFALGLMGLLLTLSFSNLRHTIKKEGPRGLSYALAADIRAARAEAQRSGRLVAACFPSDGKTNSLSRSLAIRKGAQKGRVSKSINYEGEFDATIFTGNWQESAEDKIEGEMPDAWHVSLSDELSIVFRPDGSAFSPDIWPVNGRFPILVGSSFEGPSNGPDAKPTHVQNPATVWVSSSGAIEVVDSHCPTGSLPSGQSDLNVADLTLTTGNSLSPPTLVHAQLWPEKIADLSTASIGQNYVSVHPDDKEGGHLEYGVATIELKVKDPDGGPLHYRVTANASSGDGGAFTVPERRGDLRYVYDTVEREYLWRTVIGWRPPPGAPEDIEYELLIDVIDPDGHVLDVAATGLVPRVTSLPPSRMVLCTTDEQLYLANLDGSNEIHLTKDGKEYSPFFSADGSHIFSLHELGGDTKELRRRVASGSTVYSTLSTFTGNSTNIEYDPTFMFAAITAPAGTRLFEWGRVDSDTTTTTNPDGTTTRDTDHDFFAGSTEIDVNSVFIVNLMSNETVAVSNDAATALSWNILRRHAFFYDDVVPTDFHPSTAHAPGPYRVHPGHTEHSRHQRLVGYPSNKVDIGGPTEPAGGKVINPAHRQWYLEIDGSTLRVRNDNLGVNEVVDTSPGGFQNDPDTTSRPSWAAEGTQVAYIKTSSGDDEVVTKRVLEDDLESALSSFPTLFTHSASGLDSAQLSPRGRWVYFLRGQALFRAENSSGSSPINISSHLGQDVGAYVLSP